MNHGTNYIPARLSSIHVSKSNKSKGVKMKNKSILVLICGFCTVFFVLTSTTLAQNASYIVGPGDVIEISVWKDESLSRNIIVPPDGVISFPLIGDIDVSQMTVTKLRETIRKKISDYVPDATVTVLLVQINSLQAYVIGKVNKPGQFSIDLNTTVVQVLSMAGGLNAYADEDKVSILRQNGNQTTRILFDYNEVIKGKKLEQNILIQRGDVIVVP